MAPTVTPPPYPGPFGSGPHPVLGEPSGRYPALRPNDGRGNISGAHRAVGEGSGTRSLARVEAAQSPATFQDISEEMTDKLGYETFRQNHPFDDRLYAVANRVAHTLVGSPVDHAREQARALVKLVLESEAYVPDAALRILEQVARPMCEKSEGRRSWLAVERFRNAAEVVLRQYKKSS